MWKVKLYSCQKAQAQKGPNKAGTYLRHVDKCIPDELDEYILFSDGCHAGKL
jgi:hypothetical protein